MHHRYDNGMGSYTIIGERALEGTIAISGNKNGALPCLAATLLTNQSVTLHNIPRIEDVHVMLELLTLLGSEITWLSENSLQINSNLAPDCPPQTLPRQLVKKIRASILLSGPLLGRCKAVTMAPPGGDVIGLRRLDTHFMGLEALGCRCAVSEDGYLEMSVKQLQGNKLWLNEASVTATENVIMAAVLSTGRTTITNAACEPHVQDLCQMLNAMGAKISGIGSNLLYIEGVPALTGCSYTIGPDYMEAGSFIALAAATRGEIELHNVDLQQLTIIRHGFDHLGIHFRETGPSSIIVPKRQKRAIAKAVDGGTMKIDDAPWPGFPADLLSVMTVAATQMKGTLLIHEKMYETRLYFVDWLIRMGADIILCDPHRAIVNGPKKLFGEVMTSPDVRAGMALVIAALAAQGNSVIQNIYQIERGYERLAEKLLGVGAQITRNE